MDRSISYEIVLGRVELKRITPRRKEVVTATAKGMVFLNCEDSINDKWLLHKALKVIPPNVRKMEGWTIVSIHPEKHLGYSVPSKIENVGE